MRAAARRALRQVPLHELKRALFAVDDTLGMILRADDPLGELQSRLVDAVDQAWVDRIPAVIDVVRAELGARGLDVALLSGEMDAVLAAIEPILAGGLTEA